MVKQVNTNVIPYPENILKLLELQDNHSELSDAQDQELEAWYSEQDQDYLSRWNAAVLAGEQFFQIPSKS